MKKIKKSSIILLGLLLLTVITTDVFAYYYTNYYDYYDKKIGKVMKKGTEVELGEIKNAIYLDNDNNFVLANFASNSLLDDIFDEKETFSYSDDDYPFVSDKEDCESIESDYLTFICRDDDFDRIYHDSFRYKEIPIGVPITNDILGASCLNDNTCSIDSYSRGDSYKDIEKYQFIGYVNNPEKLYSKFNFSDEEKNTINELVNKYYDKDDDYYNFFAVYKEDVITDVTLKLDSVGKNVEGTAELVSSNPENIDYIVFDLNDKLLDLKDIKAADGWDLTTFDTEDEVYDNDEDRYVDKTVIHYSLKNKNHSNNQNILDMKFVSKDEIKDDSVIIPAYQQIESVDAFVKNGEHIRDYHCGGEGGYDGAGCSTPYQSKDLGTEFYQLTKDVFYYPAYCRYSTKDDTQYTTYKASFTNVKVVPNKVIIPDSQPRIKKTANEIPNVVSNPATTNNKIIFYLSLVIIIIFMGMSLVKSLDQENEQ